MLGCGHSIECVCTCVRNFYCICSVCLVILMKLTTSEIRVEFYDEVSQMESSVDSDEDKEPHPPMEHAVKLLHLSDLSVELGSDETYPGRDGM